MSACRVFTVLPALLALVLAAGARAEDATKARAEWPQFRGPGATAVADGSPLPTTWDLKKGTNVRWKADLPGRGISSPVVAGGRIYVTACSGYRNDRLHVLCLDEASGKTLWHRQLTATGGTNCHPTTSMAGPTPVTDGRRVYALFATGDLACLDRDGNLLWYRGLVHDYPTITNQLGLAASPVLAGDTLVVNLQNEGDESLVLGLDTATGANRWKLERARDMNWVTPLVRPRGDGIDVLVQGSGVLAAHDARTGSLRWEHKGEGPGQVSSPIPGPEGVLASGGAVVALKPAEGAAPAELWKASRLRPGYTTPLFYRGRVYVASGGFLNSADAATGRTGEPLRLPVRGNYYASPIAGDGKIYVAPEDGSVLVIKAGEKPEVLATNPTGESVVATPALANGVLLLRTGSALYAITSN
jgi:outer membrane protein assembly factor BamB